MGIVTIKCVAEVEIVGKPHLTYMKELTEDFEESTAKAQQIAIDGLTVNVPNATIRGRYVYPPHMIARITVTEYKIKVDQ